MIPFEKPEFKLESANNNQTESTYSISPLERGFANTLGNALRRVLLSSLPGASVIAVKIESAFEGKKHEVHHEFSAIKGVSEDVTQIILNLKDLVIVRNDKLTDLERTELFIEVVGPEVVTGESIRTPGEVTVISKDTYICTVAEGASLVMRLLVNSGRGYLTAEENRKANYPSDYIATDCNYSPIKLAAFNYEGKRVGEDISYETLFLTVKTNGALTPSEALESASKILISHLDIFLTGSKDVRDQELFTTSTPETVDRFENMSIDNLELSQRSRNCLKRAHIETVGQLRNKTEEEMMKYKNLGKKSLQEIKKVLLLLNLNFKTFE
ncbi:MAG: DNA-directed RNA polymerase subunit alpha [Bacillales bacterium]|jgi:DNA-directed RNA polymerase subunit alpha|nr:DNA-directed RNA polymerase subunit alpha [Bacillales bacterium]